MYKVISLFFLCWLGFHLHTLAISTTITGKAPDYRNKKIYFLSQTDFITNTNDTLAQATPDRNGDFTVTLELTETRHIFVPLSYFKGLLTVEPNKTYQIQLPPFKEASEGDLLNPFFEPEEVYLNILNLPGRELNTYIRNFDEVYDQYLTSSTKELLAKGRRSDVDTFIVFMDEKFNLDSISFFKHYKQYRFARLRNLAYEKNAKSFFVKYFAGQPVLWRNDAYIQAFKATSNSFYGELIDNDQGAAAQSNFVKDANPFAMLRALNTIGKLQSDTLASLVLVYNIYTRFYKEAIAKDFAVNVMKSLADGSKIEIIRKIADKIYKRFITLMPGYPAPEFSMKDINGKDAQLRLFKGKYIYLHFYSSKSYSAKQDLPLLNALYQKHNKWLEIVTIAPKEDLESLQKINGKNEFNWTFLFYEKNNPILQTYKAKTFPTYYFLDTENRLVISPAPAPTEEFEQTVSEIVMEKERERQRGKKD